MIKTEIICIWGKGEGANHTLCEQTTAQPRLCQILKGCLNPPGSWFCMWDKMWSGIVPVCIKPAGKGDGLMHWWSKHSGRGRAGAGVDALWYHLPSWVASIVSAASSLSQAPSDPLETWRICVQFGKWQRGIWPLHKCLVFSQVHRIFLWFPGSRHIERVPAQTLKVEGRSDQFFDPSGSQIKSSQICTCLKSIYSKMCSETGNLSDSSQQLPPWAVLPTAALTQCQHIFQTTHSQLL